MRDFLKVLLFAVVLLIFTAVAIFVLQPPVPTGTLVGYAGTEPQVCSQLDPVQAATEVGDLFWFEKQQAKEGIYYWRNEVLTPDDVTFWTGDALWVLNKKTMVVRFGGKDFGFVPWVLGPPFADMACRPPPRA